MLYVDKHRPRDLSELVVHSSIGERLKQLAIEGDVPHALFYGPPGAGKKTLVMCLLRELFGPAAERLRVQSKAWKVQQASRSINVEVRVLTSACHVEVNPSDAGSRDRHVVGELIKDIARSKPIDTHSRPFKVLVLNEVDKLSKEAQHALRRTMERYSSSCRLLLVCNSLSKVIDAVRSRCMSVRVPAASEEQIHGNVLPTIAAREGLELPTELAGRIARKSERNMRRAILMLEACKAKQYPFQPDQSIELADWEKCIQSIARMVLAEQSAKKLFEVRGYLYELLVNCIPPDVVLRSLTNELLEKVDMDMKHTLSHSAAQFEQHLQQGSKPIFHIEAFLADFMAQYKDFMAMMVVE